MADLEVLDAIVFIKKQVGALHQSELTNAHLAYGVYRECISQAGMLNRNIGNVAELARSAQNSAVILNEIVNAENNAVQRLEEIEQLLGGLESRLSLV
jgi:hypothetical protein